MGRCETLAISNLLANEWAIRSPIYGLRGVVVLWTPCYVLSTYIGRRQQDGKFCTRMVVDDLLDLVGGFGRWQKFVSSVLIGSCFIPGLINMETVNTAVIPDFWWQCDGENLTEQQIDSRINVCPDVISEANSTHSGCWNYKGKSVLITVVAEVSSVLSQYKGGLSIYWDFRYKDKTIVRPSYLYNGNSCAGETTFLYWDILLSNR